LIHVAYMHGQNAVMNASSECNGECVVFLVQGLYTGCCAAL